MLENTETINRHNPFYITLDDLIKEHDILAMSFTKVWIVGVIITIICIILSIIELIVHINCIPLLASVIYFPVLYDRTMKIFINVIRDSMIKDARTLLYGKSIKTVCLNEEMALKYIKYINRNVGIITNITQNVKTYIIIAVFYTVMIMTFLFI